MRLPLIIVLGLAGACGGSSKAGSGDPTGNGGPGAITFTATGGWLEYGFAEWTALAGADGYNVYYKLASADDSAYVLVDGALVRGTRVDIPGLRSQQAYDLKVAPVTA